MKSRVSFVERGEAVGKGSRWGPCLTDSGV